MFCSWVHCHISTHKQSQCVLHPLLLSKPYFLFFHLNIKWRIVEPQHHFSPISFDWFFCCLPTHSSIGFPSAALISSFSVARQLSALSSQTLLPPKFQILGASHTDRMSPVYHVRIVILSYTLIIHEKQALVKNVLKEIWLPSGSR